MTFIHATSIVHCLPSTVFSFPRMLFSLTCRPALCGQVMILFEIYEFMRDFLNHHRNGLAIPTRQARELFGHHCNPGPIPTTFTCKNLVPSQKLAQNWIYGIVHKTRSTSVSEAFQIKKWQPQLVTTPPHPPPPPSKELGNFLITLGIFWNELTPSKSFLLCSFLPPPPLPLNITILGRNWKKA